MDVLYVIGNGSEWDNNELRYSLRSIEKFCKNVDNVYVVGSNPGFLSDEVIYIPCPDIWSLVDKHKNMLYKVCYAVISKGIKECLVSSDDHFYIKETDFNNYPYYHKGELPDKVEDCIEGRVYKKSLYDTRMLLEKYDYSYYHFGHHGNAHVTLASIKLAANLINESFLTDFGCEPYCILLNTLYSTKPFPLTERKDLKVDGQINTREELLKYIGDSEVFSIGEINNCQCAIEYLKELFPNKSKYEV